VLSLFSKVVVHATVAPELSLNDRLPATDAGFSRAEKLNLKTGFALTLKQVKALAAPSIFNELKANEAGGVGGGTGAVPLFLLQLQHIKMAIKKQVDLIIACED
jgi:hypothetical protein